MAAVWLNELSMSDAVERSVDALAAGKILLYPTDTTFALGVDATNEAAIATLFAAKRRSQAKSFSACFASADHAILEIEASPLVRRLAEGLLPGPVTLLARRKGNRYLSLAPTSDLLGFRVPDHPFCLALAAAFERPFTATSANLSGGPEAVTGQAALALAAEIGSEMLFSVLEEKTNFATPSTIIDASGSVAKVLRSGPVSEAEVLAI
ncbi:MAG: L-threonylcarbamoyladenylate synthase [Alphaproteobacteria bacterium]|nr:L-threonylcarbamoyladenylate synthase [Alphaproteobacteria bacterium]